MNSESDSEHDEICTSDGLEEPRVTSITLLPEKSKKKYEKVYEIFMEWQNRKNMNSFSENVLLTYFGELAEKYKSSSLWAHYSMLRSTLELNNKINIEKYTRLRAFLKRKSQGYQAKKAKTFTPDEINKFINDAPDVIYLATKVALIMGIMGACHASELHSMNIEDFQDLGSAILVTLPNTKTKIVRRFTITDNFYQICKKYADMRPSNVASTSFFLNYHNGKCTTQPIGINKFGAMGRQIAAFLKLPNPELYTGHSFRRSSGTLVGDVAVLKRRGGWQSISRVEGFIDDSLRNKVAMAVKPGRSISTQTTNETVHIDVNSRPLVHFTNCSNVVAEGYMADSMREKVDVPDMILQSVKQEAYIDDSIAMRHTNSQKTSPVNENIHVDIDSRPSVQFTNCSNVVADGCISDSVRDMGEKILHSVKQEGYDDITKSRVDATDETHESIKQTTNTSTQRITATNESINFDTNTTPTVHFINCSNITINFINRASDK